MSIDKRDFGAGTGADANAGTRAGADTGADANAAPEREFPTREGARLSSEGVIVSLFPDYCLVGGEIVPFTITANLSDAINTAKTVQLTGRPAVHRGTIIPCCTGAEASDGGGIHSGTVNGACWPLTWSETVQVEGEPMVRDGDLWAMNNGNTIGRLTFPSPELPPDDDDETQQQDTPRYVETPPPDGLSSESQYDFPLDEPLKPGADYARMAPPVARPAPRVSGRPGSRPAPIIPRRMPRAPDPNRDPQGYRQYWDGMPARTQSGLFYRPYPRRYWPNIWGDYYTHFHNPFLGQRQFTGMSRPWSYVVVRGDGKLDFGQGRVLEENEFEQLYFHHLYSSPEKWFAYNKMLQTQIQQRNRELELPIILSDDIEVETEDGLMVNKPKPHRKVPPAIQTLVEELVQQQVDDDNVLVTGRHYRCKVLNVCFEPDQQMIPEQNPQRSQFAREYLRQLELQEHHMNRMKPMEVMINMIQYDLMGGDRMRATARPAQRKVRKDYEQILEERYESAGYSNVKARIEAEMKKLAVLHNPDMAAGGRPFSILDPTIPIEDKIGWASVNSSIGGQWPSRRNLLRQHLFAQVLNRCKSPQVKLRNCRSIKGAPGVSTTVRFGE